MATFMGMRCIHVYSDSRKEAGLAGVVYTKFERLVVGM